MCYYCLVPFPSQNAKVLAIVIPRWSSAGWSFVYTYLMLCKLISTVEGLALYVYSIACSMGSASKSCLKSIPTSTFPVCTFRCRNMFHPYCLDGNPRSLGMPDPSFKHEQTIEPAATSSSVPS